MRTLTLFLAASSALILVACDDDKPSSKANPRADVSHASETQKSERVETKTESTKTLVVAEPTAVTPAPAEAPAPVEVAPQAEAEQLRQALARYQAAGSSEAWRGEHDNLKTLLRDLLKKSSESKLDDPAAIEEVVIERIDASFRNEAISNLLNGYFPMIYRNINKGNGEKLDKIISSSPFDLNSIRNQIVHVWADSKDSKFISEQAASSYLEYSLRAPYVPAKEWASETTVGCMIREMGNALVFIEYPIGGGHNKDYLGAPNLQLDLIVASEIYPKIGNPEVIAKSANPELEERTADSTKINIFSLLSTALKAHDKLYLDKLVYETIIPNLLTYGEDAAAFEPLLQEKVTYLENQQAQTTDLVTKADLERKIYIVRMALQNI